MGREPGTASISQPAPGRSGDAGGPGMLLVWAGEPRPIGKLRPAPLSLPGVSGANPESGLALLAEASRSLCSQMP